MTTQSEALLALAKALQEIVNLRPPGDVKRCVDARKIVERMEAIAMLALSGHNTEVAASLDAATSLFPKGTMYRSGHDGTGPDPSLFFCDAITDAPECYRVREVADTEAGARTAAALRARSLALQPEGE